MTLEPPRITYISPAYDQIWGRPGQTLYEDPRAWIEAIHPEDQERVGITFAESLQGNRLDMEYRVARPDGSLRHIHARAFPVPNPEGKSSRVVGLAEDITQRKHAETARRESEEQVRLLLESTAEAIYGIDLRGDCTFCNAACVRMLGYESSAELLGKNMHATMHHSMRTESPTWSRRAKSIGHFERAKDLTSTMKSYGAGMALAFPRSIGLTRFSETGKLSVRL